MNIGASFLRSAALTTSASFVLALLFVPLASALARRTGALAKAKNDRWHSTPTPVLGGMAIFAAAVAAMVAFVPFSRDRAIVIAGSAVLFIAGLVDDFLQLKPYQKLVCQLVCAASVVWFGLVLPWTPYYTLDLLITLLWLVGITNAINMLDNMDGLAAGVSAIAAIFLALNFLGNRQPEEALMLAALAGGLLGFLVYNHHPASIFMGDSGSMFIGFFLASIALVSGSGGGRSRSIVAVLAVPVLVLLVPIFDTTFVTLMRTMAGRAPSQGGRDHTSHRLVALGLSEKNAVWMLYTFAAAAGCLAMLVRHATLDFSLSAIAAFILLLTFTGIHLGRVRVYDEDARPRALFMFLVHISHKRRLFEVSLDVVLIVLSYYFAHALVFPPALHAAEWKIFFDTIPVVLALQLAALLVSGVYRGLWRYTSAADLVRYTRAVFAGAAASVAYVWMFGPKPMRGSVFLIDAMLLLLSLTASRFSFRLIGRLLRAPEPTSGVRVVIYGAGDAGELMLRELRSNTHLGRVPVAFLDDDPRKSGRMLNGVPVTTPNGAGSIAAVCQAYGAKELLISTAKLPMARLQQASEECQAAGVAVGRLKLEISLLALEEPA